MTAEAACAPVLLWQRTVTLEWTAARSSSNHYLYTVQLPVQQRSATTTLSAGECTLQQWTTTTRTRLWDDDKMTRTRHYSVIDVINNNNNNKNRVTAVQRRQRARRNRAQTDSVAERRSATTARVATTSATQYSCRWSVWHCSSCYWRCISSVVSSSSPTSPSTIASSLLNSDTPSNVTAYTEFIRPLQSASVFSCRGIHCLDAADCLITVNRSNSELWTGTSA